MATEKKQWNEKHSLNEAEKELCNSPSLFKNDKHKTKIMSLPYFLRNYSCNSLNSPPQVHTVYVPACTVNYS